MQEHTLQRHRRRGRAASGFTLVEMLVVVVVIIILLGVVFKMVKPAGDKAAKAKTEAILAKLKAAVEEFHAEYGQYPPVPYYRNVDDPAFSIILGNGATVKGGGRRVDTGAVPPVDVAQPLFYEYASKEGMDSNLTGVFGDRSWDEAPVFTFGLMGFLVARYDGHAENGWPTLFNLPQWANYNNTVDNKVDDQPRDRRAAERWAPFLADITTPDDVARRVGGGASGQFYINKFITVLDAWERPFVYISPPPHQSYLLFSCGPDKQYDSNDPHNRDLAYNRDNIYGDTGF